MRAKSRTKARDFWEREREWAARNITWNERCVWETRHTTARRLWCRPHIPSTHPIHAVYNKYRPLDATKKFIMAYGGCVRVRETWMMASHGGKLIRNWEGYSPKYPLFIHIPSPNSNCLLEFPSNSIASIIALHTYVYSVFLTCNSIARFSGRKLRIISANLLRNNWVITWPWG